MEAEDGSEENKIVIKNVDMAEDMQQAAIEVALVAKKQSSIEKDIASHIKRDFDRRFGATWHCIVGRNYGSYVTHGKWKMILESKHFIYFYMGRLAILLFKTCDL